MTTTIHLTFAQQCMLAAAVEQLVERCRARVEAADAPDRGVLLDELAMAETLDDIAAGAEAVVVTAHALTPPSPPDGQTTIDDYL